MAGWDGHTGRFPSSRGAPASLGTGWRGHRPDGSLPAESPHHSLLDAEPYTAPFPDANVPADPATSSAFEAELLELRDRFPILETSTYLISNSLGAMPEGVYAALRHYADTWSGEGVRAWEQEWWMLGERVGDAIGEIIGAPAGTVSVHQNVTLGSAVIASCFDFEKARNKVVCSELNFPSIVQLYRQQEPRGARLHLVPCPDGMTVPVEEMLAAIDESTLLVPISHVVFKSSYVQDVEAIVARAREVGALVVLDAYQSVGIMPVDVQALDVDFAVGGVLKWLCGGPGVSYLYVRPELIERLRPAITGWFARENAFAFDARDESWRPDAWRFLNGTTHIPALSAALPGLEIVGGLDAAAVRAKSLRQTERIIRAADENGWQLNTPREPDRRAGHVVIDMPGSERVTEELLERRIMVDHRPGAGIRLAPHFYTTDAEIELALETIRELAQ